MTKDLTKVRQRVRKLLAKTVARGCTEAEALAAAETAARLMAEYGINEGDLPIDQKSSKTDQAGRGGKGRLWPMIAHCTNTAIIVEHRPEGPEVTFIGREPWPDVAVYLRTVCERAIDRELRIFKGSLAYRRKRKAAVKREMAAEFVWGMVSRLRARLLEIFGPHVDANQLAEAQRALRERYPETEDIKSPTIRPRHSDAAAAGARSGDNVHLAHGVETAGTPLAIGASS